LVILHPTFNLNYFDETDDSRFISDLNLIDEFFDTQTEIFRVRDAWIILFHANFSLFVEIYAKRVFSHITGLSYVSY